MLNLASVGRWASKAFRLDQAKDDTHDEAHDHDVDHHIHPQIMSLGSSEDVDTVAIMGWLVALVAFTVALEMTLHHLEHAFEGNSGLHERLEGGSHGGKEHGHAPHQHLNHRQQMLHKVKDELMVMGLLSFFLTVFGECVEVGHEAKIPFEWAHTLLFVSALVTVAIALGLLHIADKVFAETHAMENVPTRTLQALAASGGLGCLPRVDLTKTMLSRQVDARKAAQFQATRHAFLVSRGLPLDTFNFPLYLHRNLYSFVTALLEVSPWSWCVVAGLALLNLARSWLATRGEARSRQEGPRVGKQEPKTTTTTQQPPPGGVSVGKGHCAVEQALSCEEDGGDGGNNNGICLQGRPMARHKKWSRGGVARSVRSVLWKKPAAAAAAAATALYTSPPAPPPPALSLGVGFSGHSLVSFHSPQDELAAFALFGWVLLGCQWLLLRKARRSFQTLVRNVQMVGGGSLHLDNNDAVKKATQLKAREEKKTKLGEGGGGTCGLEHDSSASSETPAVEAAVNQVVPEVEGGVQDGQKRKKWEEGGVGNGDNAGPGESDKGELAMMMPTLGVSRILSMNVYGHHRNRHGCNAEERGNGHQTHNTKNAAVVVEAAEAVVVGAGDDGSDAVASAGVAGVVDIANEGIPLPLTHEGVRDGNDQASSGGKGRCHGSSSSTATTANSSDSTISDSDSEGRSNGGSNGRAFASTHQSQSAANEEGAAGDDDDGNGGGGEKKEGGEDEDEGSSLTNNKGVASGGGGGGFSSSSSSSSSPDSVVQGISTLLVVGSLYVAAFLLRYAGVALGFEEPDFKARATLGQIFHGHFLGETGHPAQTLSSSSGEGGLGGSGAWSHSYFNDSVRHSAGSPSSSGSSALSLLFLALDDAYGACWVVRSEDLALGFLALLPLVLAWQTLHELVDLASFTKAVVDGSDDEVASVLELSSQAKLAGSDACAKFEAFFAHRLFGEGVGGSSERKEKETGEVDQVEEQEEDRDGEEGLNSTSLRSIFGEYADAGSGEMNVYAFRRLLGAIYKGEQLLPEKRERVWMQMNSDLWGGVSFEDFQRWYSSNSKREGSSRSSGNNSRSRGNMNRSSSSMGGASAVASGGSNSSGSTLVRRRVASAGAQHRS